MAKSKFGKLVYISRPRFYPYLLGTYLVGFTSVANKADFLSLTFLLTFIFFTLPANLFLYGINDLYDSDTDKYSVKKKGKEFVASQKDKLLSRATLYCFLIGIVTLIIQTSFLSMMSLSLFLALSYLYSASPFRLKARPFLDFGANFLYITPGLVGYFQNTNTYPPLLIILAASFWAFAMHIFSAIPDIKADKNAQLKTTAVFLGRKNAIILCVLFWSLTSFILFYINMPVTLSLVSLTYPSIAFLAFKISEKDYIKLYWYFPAINLIVGFLLFSVSALHLL
ncbi:prenyltransferase [Candidatus Woesebacteria bacterium]|nr:MAG: prenyltransferase [Candidatus Woesebacteria bacterium]